MDCKGYGAVNILIVKLSAIGDVIHTLPSLGALRRAFPHAHITWLVEEAAAEIVLNHPDLDQVLISRRKTWMKMMKEGQFCKPLGEIKYFIRILRERKFDLVIDFHGLFKSALLVFLSHSGRTIGYDSYQELSGLFYREKIKEDMSKHAVDRYLDFLTYLSINDREAEFKIAIGDQNRKKVQQLLAEDRIQDAFIAINPVAYWKTKLWDDKSFADLCDRLKEAYPSIPVILTGQPSPSLEKIRSLCHRDDVVNWEGRTTLKDLAELYRRAILLITTDSGPMHLAAAMGTPVVALFGPTNPLRTGPYGSGHVVIQEDIPCVPCLLKTCDKMTCMKNITVDTVMQGVARALNKA
jgi:3-deoxy-D-manno-octulosonic-acid transferase/heptosyltransferase-1